MNRLMSHPDDGSSRWVVRPAEAWCVVERITWTPFNVREALGGSRRNAWNSGSETRDAISLPRGWESRPGWVGKKKTLRGGCRVSQAVRLSGGRLRGRGREKPRKHGYSALLP